MTKKTNDSEKLGHKRSFLSNLLVALAPQDELMLYASRQAPKDHHVSTEMDHEDKPLMILTRSARHLGSV